MKKQGRGSDYKEMISGKQVEPEFKNFLLISEPEKG